MSADKKSSHASYRHSGCNDRPIVLSIFIDDILIDEVYSVESAEAFVAAWNEGRGMREALKLADDAHIEQNSDYSDDGRG